MFALKKQPKEREALGLSKIESCLADGMSVRKSKIHE